MHQLFANAFYQRGEAGTQQLVADLNTNNITLSEIPEFAEALTQMQMLRELGLINEDFMANTFEMPREKFATRQVAMHPCGDFILTPLADEYPEFDMDDIGFMTIPLGNSHGVIAGYTGVGLSISSTSENMEAALGFMDFFARQDIQEEFMRAGPGLNVFGDVDAGSNPISYDMARYALEGRVMGNIGDMFEAWPEMEARSLIQELMIGTMTAEQMLAQLDEHVGIIARGRGMDGW